MKYTDQGITQHVIYPLIFNTLLLILFEKKINKRYLSFYFNSLLRILCFQEFFYIFLKDVIYGSVLASSYN